MWEPGRSSLANDTGMSKGKSATSVISPLTYIRAVHNIEWDNDTAAAVIGKGPVAVINSAVAITPIHYTTILSWISRSFEGNAFVAGNPFSPSRVVEGLALSPPSPKQEPGGKKSVINQIAGFLGT